MTEIETIQNVETHMNETLKTELKPTISIYDYMEMSDSHIKEERLLKSFDLKLDKVEKKGQLKDYETSLKEMKKGKQLKVNGFKAIALGTGFLIEKWNEEIKPYLVKTGFKFTEKEYTDMVKDPKNIGQLKPVQKIKIVNNLKDTSENNWSYIISFMLENFKLEEKLITDLQELLKTCSKTEDFQESHTVKANSEIIGIATSFVKNRLEETQLNLDSYIKRNEMSVNFINWKLKRIQIRKNTTKQATLNKEAIDMNEKIASRMKEDKNFAELMNIAKKWSL